MKTQSDAKAFKRRQNPLRFSAEADVSGSADIQNHMLRPGLVLSVFRPGPDVQLKTFFDIDDAPIQFGFTCSGKNRCSYSGGRLRNQSHEMQAGSNGIFYLPETHGTIERSNDNPPFVMAIIASPQLLYHYFSESMDELPKTFRKNLEGCKDSPMTWFGPNTPAKQSLMQQILDCPRTNGVSRLFLESRVMELLGIQIQDYIEFETGSAVGQKKLGPSDVERIHHARDILVSDMENPPTLAELAIHVGINQKKLKHGFRQVYNTSVYGYFREFRMQKARELLQQGDSNVTEAAYAVGYQSLSHFSEAFKKRFGLLPKDLLANQRHLFIS